ncbi:MAG: 3'(2'),5'-bisphosphate nucleotidase CysQ [Desulfobacterales bacterium]|nr:MAG: 3'(2'),5'-bisphosphate nucleotidase CysQ [Desulfobacterales bacterium]
MNHEPYLIKAIKASVEAGNAIVDVYHSNFAVEYKTDSSPLTLADKRSHEIITKNLAEFNIPVLSEEGKNISFIERKSWKRLWIVDPLDGTKEFIKRNGEFTVNIALVEDGNAVLGVIFIPVKSTLYFGARNFGAFKLENGLLHDLLRSQPKVRDKASFLKQLLAHSAQLPLSQSPRAALTIVGSRSHATPELEAYVERKRQEVGNVEFISAGSSLKFCLVAEGNADIYPKLGPTMEWDTAAGQVIAENAGAQVVQYDSGEPLVYNKEDLLNPWHIVKRAQ